MLQLNEEARKKLVVQADLELARRSLSGSLVHFILLLVIAVFPPYFHEHPAVIVTTGSILLVLGAIRLAFAFLFPVHYPKNPALWKQLFRIGAYAVAVTWGTFSCLTMALYSQQWVSWFVLLLTTGIAAGASSSLSPDYALYRRYALLLLGPTVAWGLIRGGLGGYPVAITVTLYGGYLLIQGRQQSRSYWQILTDSTLLSMRTSRTEEQEAYLKALIEESPLAIVVLDMQHRIQMCNWAFEHLFLYQPQEIVGADIDELLQTEELASEMRQFTQLTETGNPVHATTRRRRKDGTLVDVEIHGVPLVVDKKLIGICALYQDSTDRKLAETRLYEANRHLANRVLELQRRSNEITVLSEMGNLLQTCQTADEAYKVISSSAHRLFLASTGALCMLGTSRNVVETVATWGEPLWGERAFAPEDCWALRRGQIHRFDASGRTARCRHINEGPVSESLCVPLMAQREALGILHLQEATRADAGHQENTPRRFGEVEQRLAAVLAEQIALALANLNLKENLRKQSICDPLTGLFNRRYMEESLERELRRAVRRHAPLGVAMLDLDHFKQFNDKFGHDAGDALLCDIGKLLRARLRAEDIVCRYGGEEFTLILPDASLKNIRQRAEQLREEIKSLENRWKGQQPGSFTLSIGVAAFPEHGSTPESLLKAADRALYRAKAEGRDRVMVALAADLKPA